MGLDDLVPDDKEASGSSSTSRPRGGSSSPDTIEIGSEPYKKVFTEEKWEEVRRVMIDEMGLVPNKVVNNYKTEERYEVLHEAALAVEGEKAPEELDNYQNEQCEICGVAANETSVVIDGHTVCVSHTAGQVKVLLDED